MKNLKQVIVMRTDLNMRKGKMVAQGAHSVAIALLSIPDEKINTVEEWANSGMTKICVGIDSAEALLDLAERASKAGLTVRSVTDAGRTEFHGEPTNTCICIGPDESEEIDKFTGGLKLL